MIAIPRVLNLPILTTVLLICSVSVNVVMARKVTSLRGVISELKEDALLKVGASVPAVQVTSINGEELTFDPRGTTPTLVYVFAPSCGWCSRNVANIKAIQAGAQDRFRVVGLTLSAEGLDRHVAEVGYTFPIFTMNNDTRQRLKLGGTPQTLWIGPDGRLLKNWRGAYQGSLKKDVETQLRLTLPGLVLPPSGEKKGD